jgi:hypothetical protein
VESVANDTLPVPAVNVVVLKPPPIAVLNVRPPPGFETV